MEKICKAFLSCIWNQGNCSEYLNIKAVEQGEHAGKIFFPADKGRQLFGEALFIIGSFYFSQIEADGVEKLFIGQRGKGFLPVSNIILIHLSSTLRRIL